MMNNVDAILTQISQTRTLADRAPSDAVDAFGNAVDIASEANRADILRHLATLAKTIRPDSCGPDAALLDYFLGNLWSAIRRISSPYRSGSWDWDTPELRQEIICLRRALGPYSIAARDILTAPPVVARLGEGPRFHGFFNQIKQEFCSARWLAYEAMSVPKSHFSDRGVLLYNTLDYPSYSLTTEKLKLAFRSSYSLFDKIAYFLNSYMNLQIPETNVSFRGIWHEKQDRRRPLRSEFRSRRNLPFRGLYWLSNDLYEEAFRSVIDPDAQRLNSIRNDLEHKYLKLHLELWRGCKTTRSRTDFVDTLPESLYRSDFEAMTVRLLTLARTALIYLSLGVHQEEQVRAANRPSNKIIPPTLLDAWEDTWKY